MKRMILGLIGGAVVASTVWATEASASHRTIDGRQHHQQARIRQGVRSGELTRQEASQLGRQQHRIRVDERRARSDGEVTARERRHLHRSLNHASRNIYRQKHDGQSR